MYWNEVWDVEKTKLAAMTPRERLVFCLSCLEWSLQELRSSLHACVGEENVRWLERVLDAVPGHPAKVEITKPLSDFSDDVSEFVEMAEIKFDNTGGFYDLGMGLVELIDSVRTDLSAEETYYVASYAYQAVFTVEVLASLEESVTEAVTTELERQNGKCVKVIEAQLKMAIAVSGGKSIEDMGLYPRSES